MLFKQLEQNMPEICTAVTFGDDFAKWTKSAIWRLRVSWNAEAPDNLAFQPLQLSHER